MEDVFNSDVLNSALNIRVGTATSSAPNSASKKRTRKDETEDTDVGTSEVAVPSENTYAQRTDAGATVVTHNDKILLVEGGGGSPIARCRVELFENCFAPGHFKFMRDEPVRRALGVFRLCDHP